MPEQKGLRELKVPPGDDKPRSTCNDCGHIDYGNPKPIVGAVVTHEGKILLCRRGIEPRKGSTGCVLLRWPCVPREPEPPAFW